MSKRKIYILMAYGGSFLDEHWSEIVCASDDKDKCIAAQDIAAKGIEDWVNYNNSLDMFHLKYEKEFPLSKNDNKFDWKDRWSYKKQEALTKFIESHPSPKSPWDAGTSFHIQEVEMI